LERKVSLTLFRVGAILTKSVSTIIKLINQTRASNDNKYFVS